MRTLSVGTGPQQQRLANFSSHVVTNIHLYRPELPWIWWNKCVCFLSFQHVEGPECQLHGQLGLHTFTSCLAERAQVRPSEELCRIVTDITEETRGPALI